MLLLEQQKAGSDDKFEKWGKYRNIFYETSQPLNNITGWNCGYLDVS